MHCFGRNLDDHCCYVDGVPCPFLERNTDRDQKFSCQLRRQNGSWARAIADSRYTASRNSPGIFFKQFGYDCATYQCAECQKLEAGTITQAEFIALKAT